ncbi:hypothetical protein O6H91_Y469100 [Diphasiastrum complanatum]|nr:hypothetical protein O6H91_Y469100 [Diphasiastrum complanatum]
MRNASSIWFRAVLRVASLILVSIVIWNRFTSPGLSTSSDLNPNKSNIITQKHPYFRARSVLSIHEFSSYGKGSQTSNPRKRPLVILIEEKDDILTNGTKFLQGANATSDISIRPFNNDSDISSNSLTDLSACQAVREHIGFEDSCAFVRAHAQCRSGGVVEYADFFFCGCKNAPVLGYSLLAIWLMALFYMLGNTAADYFCPSLEKLSSLLHLPPTVAGVTLLPLGNGAPDVFASIAAFVGAGAGEVGLNSVLGGAVFVTSVVAGAVCLLVAGTSPRLDQRSFIRDVSFFLGTLLALFLILFLEQINLWGALAFVSIYVVYAITVAASECLKRKPHKLHWHVLEPVLGHTQAFSSSFTKEGDEDGWYSPLMDPESEHDPGLPETSLPQWMWVSHNAIFSHQAVPEKLETSRPLWGWTESQVTGYTFGMAIRKFFNILVEYPLILPRQLTIPIVEDDRWSRFFAVASVILAPILVAWVGSTGNGFSVRQSWSVYAVGLSFGVLFGLFAFFTTIPEHPPRRFLFHGGRWVCHEHCVVLHYSEGASVSIGWNGCYI